MTTADDGRRETRALLLALGAFVVSFSQMVSAMQRAVALMLEDPAKGARVVPPDRNRLLDSLFEPLTAAPISLAYFSLCAQVGELNDDDRTIHGALRRLVDDYIRRRNQVMHADWQVGWAVADTGEPVPPTAHKIRTAKWQTRYESLSYSSPASIEQLAGQMGYVAGLLRTFGQICRDRQCGDVDVHPSSRLALYVLEENNQRLVRHAEDERPHAVHIFY